MSESVDPKKRAAGDAEDAQALREAMSKITHKIVVLSGKGGVGKSTVAVNLAVSLAEKKYRTGLLDVDIHGPSVPGLLGLQGAPVSGSPQGKLLPVEFSDYLKVISIGFLLSDRNDAIIYRGPMKHSVIKQFLTDVDWGDLDYLIIDSPPGTGDEPLSVCQLIADAEGAVIVTTPQEVALSDVRKSINFCHKLNMPVLGVVENMSGFICPHCGKESYIFKKDGGRKMAKEMDVPFLGSIPLEPGIMEQGDAGEPFCLSSSPSVAAESFKNIVEKLTTKNN
jgi:Mrp family chromosome partitioning ATPase